MKHSIPLFLAFVAFTLAACATQSGVRPRWTMDSKDFAAIKPQSMDKDEVKRQVGAPIFTSTFTNLSEEVWDYRFMDGAFPYAAEVHFDMQGKVKYVATYPDSCSSLPVGCR